MKVLKIKGEFENILKMIIFDFLFCNQIDLWKLKSTVIKYSHH